MGGTTVATGGAAGAAGGVDTGGADDPPAEPDADVDEDGAVLESAGDAGEDDAVLEADGDVVAALASAAVAEGGEDVGAGAVAAPDVDDAPIAAELEDEVDVDRPDDASSPQPASAATASRVASFDRIPARIGNPPALTASWPRRDVDRPQEL